MKEVRGEQLSPKLHAKLLGRYIEWHRQAKKDRVPWKRLEQVMEGKAEAIPPKYISGTKLLRKYQGEVYEVIIEYKGQISGGQHEAILTEELFNRVQKQLAENNHAHKLGIRQKITSLLGGILFDDANNRMGPHTLRCPHGWGNSAEGKQLILQQSCNISCTVGEARDRRGLENTATAITRVFLLREGRNTLRAPCPRWGRVKWRNLLSGFLRKN